jgi:SAM-dependent methyltransferase
LHLFAAPHDADKDTGHLTAITTEKTLNAQTRTKDDIVTVENPGAPERMESILDWWFEAGHEVLIAEVMTRANSKFAHWVRSSDRMLEFLYDGAQNIIGGSQKTLGAQDPWAEKSGIMIEPQLRQALRTQSLALTGTGQKARLLSHLIRERLNERPFWHVDFSNDYGLLSAEIALSFPLAKCVTRSSPTTHLVFAETLFRGLRFALQGRFYFSLGPAEGFGFEHNFDVISFMEGLSHIPQETRAETLQACWANLAPGGFILVSENLAAESASADSDIGSTIEGVENLLGGFGQVCRYAANSLREVVRDEAVDTPLCHLIQKTA